ncbi:MAG: hypothetical protein QM737_01750 [Ferruginibacter sp.]
MQKKFSFLFPITESFPDTNRREGLSFGHMGDWRISGIAYKKAGMLKNTDFLYEYEIDEIVYDGTDINPVLETAEIFEKVKAACKNHIHYLFQDEETNNEIPTIYKIGRSGAKVIDLLLRRKAQ